jgi:hypothetical protein
MIIKKRDSKQAEIDEIATLLSVPLPENKKCPIERDLRFIKSGKGLGSFIWTEAMHSLFSGGLNN